MKPQEVTFDIVFSVYVSWTKIKDIPNYAEVAGEILFRRIFEIAPGAEKLFPFGANASAKDDKFFQNPIFKAHSRGVVAMLNEAVLMLGPDMEPVLEALESLGARHVDYGVLPPHYDIVGAALLHTLEVALQDNWTPEVRQGWTLVYGVVSAAMLQGAKKKLQKKEQLSSSPNAEALKSVEVTVEE